MSTIEFKPDRQIISTDNNEFVDGDRDENLWDEDLANEEIPLDDNLPDELYETGRVPRPEFNEQEYRNHPGQ